VPSAARGSHDETACGGVRACPISASEGVIPADRRIEAALGVDVHVGLLLPAGVPGHSTNPVVRWMFTSARTELDHAHGFGFALALYREGPRSVSLEAVEKPFRHDDLPL
jgi:hypothetical protein